MPGGAQGNGVWHLQGRRDGDGATYVAVLGMLAIGVMVAGIAPMGAAGWP